MSATPFYVDPDIFAKVQFCFAEALGLDEEEVTLDARVIDDLGAESLDFLDIAFRLERTFDVKIPRGGIEQAAREGLEAGETYEVNGVLTELALKKLAEGMPEVPAEEFVPGLKVSEVPILFRVATFYRMIVALLDEKARAAG